MTSSPSAGNSAVSDDEYEYGVAHLNSDGSPGHVTPHRTLESAVRSASGCNEGLPKMPECYAVRRKVAKWERADV